MTFAEENGLPIAIKAAFGGGGRGLKVAREMSEVADAYESAVREAVSAFGRGECFVEKFLDRPRHVETQCLADQHGNVVVVSTRDCSLQRRHQKLVEEAPAPFLSDDQVGELYDVVARRSSRRPATSAPAPASSWSAATAPSRSSRSTPASRSSTRSPRRSPASTWSARCSGSRPGRRSAMTTRRSAGHSIEFRINAEDGGQNFMPAPGTLSRWHQPSGPGVRVDGGYDQGETIPGSFDSLVAKLIVTGRDRTQALERSRRALAEFVVDGMPTVIPFHLAVVDDPAYIGDGEKFDVYTTWIETDFDNQIEPYAGESAEAEDEGERQKVTVEVGGRRIEVVLPAGLGGLAATGGGAKKPKRSGGKKAGAAASGDSVTSPMQGTIVKVVVEEGQEVAEGDADRGHRGDEDGAAAQGPQVRHGHQPAGRGRRRPSPTAR